MAPKDFNSSCSKAPPLRAEGHSLLGLAGVDFADFGPLLGGQAELVGRSLQFLADRLHQLLDLRPQGLLLFRRCGARASDIRTQRPQAGNAELFRSSSHTS